MSIAHERALAVTCQNDLLEWTDGYGRLYFGTETCRYLLPGPDELKKMLDFCADKRADFTLLTPVLGDKQFPALELLLKLLADSVPGAEVVFNDWGVFSLCCELNLEPVVGRLLSRQRKDPRIREFIDELPLTGAQRYRQSGLNPDMVEFLASYGCRRAELDVLPQGLFLDPELTERFSFSVHEPYSLVWTTRECPLGPVGFDAAECSRSCREKSFTLEHPNMPKAMVCKGNSLFARSGRLDEETAQLISRTVVHAGKF